MVSIRSLTGSSPGHCDPSPKGWQSERRGRGTKPSRRVETLAEEPVDRPDHPLPLPRAALLRERRLQRRRDLGVRRRRVPGRPRTCLAERQRVAAGAAAARGADDDRAGRRAAVSSRRTTGSRCCPRAAATTRSTDVDPVAAGGGAGGDGVVRRPHRATPSRPASPAAPAASPATACGSSPAGSATPPAEDGEPPRARVAATWTPDPTVAEDFHAYADEQPRASLPVTWAALDCVGGWAGDLEERLMVLARMTAAARLAAGDRRGARAGRHGPRTRRPQDLDVLDDVRRRRTRRRQRRAPLDRRRPGGVRLTWPR